MPCIPFDSSGSSVGRRQVLARLAMPLFASWLAACDRLPGAGSAPAFKGLDITGAPYGRDFSLVDFNGQERTLADFRGKVVMLYFGFVQCPDVCPTALSRAAAIGQQLGAEAADLQLLFVTVDPERDTPELLRNYLAAFDPSFLALTGRAEQIQAVADEFRVYFKKVPTGSSYTMDHTALTYLFDRQGHLRVAMRHEQGVEDYVADIRVLLHEAGPV
ncbi:MAG: SCO family protein [Burkholderiaceae bacterium]